MMELSGNWKDRLGLDKEGEESTVSEVSDTLKTMKD